jgi:hypothetical protein
MSRGIQSNGVKSEDLRCFDELLGRWEIRHPDSYGLLKKAYSELLQLKGDGTFLWDPNPLWAKPEGCWGIIIDTDTQRPKLYFEERKGVSFRGHWLVFIRLPFGDREETMIHWQRTRCDAVVFGDRIWAGRMVMKTRESSSVPTGTI